MAGFVARWRMLLLGIVAFAFSAMIHGAFHFAPAGTRPVPWLAEVPWIVACFALPACIASVVAAWRRASGGLAKLGAVTLHLLAALGGVAGVAASTPGFPFVHSHVASLRLPGEQGSAHLYRGGLFCSQTVWRSAPGEVWARRDSDIGSKSCDHDAWLQWDDATGRVHLVGLDGRALPSPAHFEGLGEALDWRPH